MVEWSKDKELYKKLCSRDSEINNLNQLAEVYNKKWQNSDLEENISWPKKKLSSWENVPQILVSELALAERTDETAAGVMLDEVLAS